MCDIRRAGFAMDTAELSKLSKLSKHVKRRQYHDAKGNQV